MLGSHFSVQDDYKDLLEEAEENIKNNEPKKLLYKMIEEYMYMSSGTYYNWYHEHSSLDNLPVIRNPEKWEQFESIDVPILTFSGENETDNYLHLDLLKAKAINCRNFKYDYIKGTNHFYKDKEKEVGKLILNWIKDFKIS